MKSTPVFALGVMVGLLSLHGAGGRSLYAEDWHQFLGQNRDGISSESGFVNSLDAQSPPVKWRVRGGVGMSAVAVADGHAVTMWNADGKQWLVALDTITGERRWATPVAAAYENSMGDGPRATPAIVNSVVYAFTGEGRLVAADLTSGHLLWKTDAVERNNARPSEYGMSSSPLVVDGRVIVHVGGAQAAVSAFDAATGAGVWTAGSGAAGYSSPTLLQLGGVDQLVCFVAMGVLALDPQDGRLLWDYPFKTPYDCNTATPIATDGGVFISAGENHGCVLLDVKKEGSRYVVSERWQSVETKSVMRNEWQTSVVSDGYLFGFDNVGSAGPVTHLSCIKADTGEQVWRRTRFGKGNLTLADGKLWITTMQGELVLVEASPTAYRELGRVNLLGKTRQSISIANGHGYLRDDQEVICVRLTK